MHVGSSCFADSNVLLYLVGEDERKSARALEILALRPRISVQVLNEFANVSRKKWKLDWDEIRTGLETVQAYCEVLPLDLGVHQKALEIAEANLLGMYDSLIIAAAEIARCDVLYTEDMNHGQRIGAVAIRNPFVAA